MNAERLCEIIRETTQEFRKGEGVVHSDHTPTLRVMSIFMMPPVSDAPTDLKMVDVHFMKIGVDMAKAEARREELIDLLNCWGDDGANLSEGPSYISVGRDLGSQSLALDLFALGEALGLWKVITPAAMGIPDGDARGDELAGSGFVFMSAYHRK